MWFGAAPSASAGPRSKHPGTCALVRSRESPEAFAAYYDAHRAVLLRHFIGQTRNLQVALDLTAETFAKAFEKRSTFRGGDDTQAAAWLWAIARNELSGYLRARRVELRAIERLGLERQQQPEEAPVELARIAGIRVARERIHEAVANLPADQRAVIELRFGRDLDSQAVGSCLGIPSDAVRARLSRAYRKLRVSPRVSEATEALETG
jgi:RNA polymerase sigma-70 factor, ECF subfamily